jgi:hypothetical protein
MTPLNVVTHEKEKGRVMTQTESTVRRHVMVDSAIDRARVWNLADKRPISEPIIY